MESRKVNLPNGNTLELQVTETFYAKVRQQFQLPVGEPVSDDHLRMFVYGAMKTAIDKADKG